MSPHKFTRPAVSIVLALQLLCLLDAQRATAQRKVGRRAQTATNARADTTAPDVQTNRYVTEGLRSAAEGKWAEAIKAYRHALVDDPQDAAAYLNLGDAYLNSAQDKEAIAAYQQAVRLAPKNANAQYALGAAYNFTGQNSDAFKPLVRAISLAPDYAEAYYGIGYAYQQLDNYKEAVGYLKNAIRLKPDYPEAYLALGLSYLGLGDLKTAEAQLNPLQAQDAALAKELAKAIEKKAGPAAARSNAQTNPVARSGQPAAKQTEAARRPTSDTATQTPAQPVNTTTLLNVELSFWDSIKNSSDPAEYDAYLKKYPTGQFVELAKIRLRALENKQSGASAPASAPTSAPVEPRAESPVSAPPVQPTPEQATQSSEPPAVAPTPGSEKPVEPDNPTTLEQTIEWIRKYLPAKLAYQVTTPGATPDAAPVTRATQIDYELLRFESCTLAWRDQTDTLTVALAELDPASVRVELRQKPDTTFSMAVWNVSITATGGQGAFHETKGDGSGAENRYNGIDLQYSDKETAERLARALQHAIKLCGGKSAPASS